MQVKCYYKNGTIFKGEFNNAPHKVPHRLDGPAIEWANGTKEWYLNGKRHREDGPAVEYPDGNREWWLNGKRHRANGPAIEYSDGTKKWWLDGELHREDGPAVEYTNGTKMWYQNGKLHRADGPAVERKDGTKEWWILGRQVKILSKKYLIRYMELTGECLASLLLSTDKMLRESTRKYKWKELKI